MDLHKRGPRPSEAEVLALQPVIDETVMLCVRAWHDCGNCRPLGFAGLGEIPLTAVMDWCDLEGFGRTMTKLMVAVIRRLDADRSEREASRRSLS